MSRIPTHTLDSAPTEVRPLLEHVAQASLSANGRLLNLHGEMAHAPIVLAAYAGMRKATEDYGTFDFKTRTAIMLSVSCAERSDYAVAVNTMIAQRAGWSDDEIDELKGGHGLGDPRFDALLTVVRDAATNGGSVPDTTWKAAIDAGNTAVELAEAFAYIGLTRYVDHFLAFAQTELDVPAHSAA